MTEIGEYRIDSDENSDYMYNLIARVLEKAPTRLPCSENERKGSEFIQEELNQYCDDVHQEDFTCYPGAFLGWTKLVPVMLIISIVVFLLTPFNSWIFAAIALGVLILAFLIVDMQFLRYEEWTPKFLPYKLEHSQNVIGTLKPEGAVEKRVVFSGHIDSALRMDLIQYTRAGFGFIVVGGLITLFSLIVVYAVQIIFSLANTDAATIQSIAFFFNWIAFLEPIITAVIILIGGRSPKLLGIQGALHNTNRATYVLILGDVVYAFLIFIFFYPFLFFSNVLPPVVRTIIFLSVINLIILISWFFFVTNKGVPGVLDNLTAVAVSTCIAKILAEWRQNYPEKFPKHTEVIIAIVGCEEAGMRGAEAFAAKHAAEYNTIDTTCVNFESIADSSLVRIFTKEQTTGTALSPEVYNLLDQCATELGINHEINEQPGISGGTDAAGLVWGGLKASSLCGLRYQDYLAYQHTQNDNIKLVNKERRPWNDNGTNWQNRNIRGAMEQSLCIAIRYLERKDAET